MEINPEVRKCVLITTVMLSKTADFCLTAVFFRLFLLFQMLNKVRMKLNVSRRIMATC